MSEDKSFADRLREELPAFSVKEDMLTDTVVVSNHILLGYRAPQEQVTRFLAPSEPAAMEFLVQQIAEATRKGAIEAVNLQPTIDKLVAQARARGYQEGHNNGRNLGYQTGYRAGLEAAVNAVNEHNASPDLVKPWTKQ